MNFIRHMRDNHALGMAVKEAFDSLPSAVCYFKADGSIKLCNTAMYDIYRKIAGNDLQSFDELNSALKKCGSSTEIIRDGNYFLFSDGSVLKYAVRKITTAEGRTYTETMFSNVTELYRKRRELEQQSQKLKQMYSELNTLSGQLLELTREQEILNTKTRLHDQMNMGIAAIRQILRQNATLEENALAVAQFRRAIRILQEENSYPQDDLAEFIRDAAVSGVRVSISGELPKEKNTLQLLVTVMREACVNAARHADASLLNIVSELNEKTISLYITNDGKVPEKETEPYGGLKDLENKIRKAGGTMKIRSLPEYMLTVTLPVRVQEMRKEAEP